jgi:hypothetical protein
MYGCFSGITHIGCVLGAGSVWVLVSSHCAGLCVLAVTWLRICKDAWGSAECSGRDGFGCCTEKRHLGIRERIYVIELA